MNLNPIRNSLTLSTIFYNAYNSYKRKNSSKISRYLLDTKETGPCDCACGLNESPMVHMKLRETVLRQSQKAHGINLHLDIKQPISI